MMPWILSRFFRSDSPKLFSSEVDGSLDLIHVLNDVKNPSALPPSGDRKSRGLAESTEEIRGRCDTLPIEVKLCPELVEITLDSYGKGSDDLRRGVVGCFGCGLNAIGILMTAGDLKYHPECFVCCQCCRIIGVSEPFVVLGLTALHCGKCFIQHETVGNQEHDSLPLSIRMVEVPPLDELDQPAGLSLQLLESNSNGLSPCLQIVRADGRRYEDFRVGDRILEIDGCPITYSNWDKAEESISAATKYFYVTIQRGNNEAPRDDQRSPPHLPVSVLEAAPSVRSSDHFRARSASAGRRRSRSSSLPRSSTIDEADFVTRPTSRLSRCPVNHEKISKPELVRGLSHRHDHKGHQAFRPSDLVEMEEIGRGTYGITYKVCHRETNEIMTMKKLYRFDRVAQEDFLKESAMLRQVDHPNVLRFIGVMIKGQNLHIVTEYVPGGTLEELINDQERVFCWANRVRAARDIAAGLAYLHSISIIHRDLKVDNCLVREDGSVVVADFGLSCILQKIPNARHSTHDCSLDEADASSSCEDSSSSKKRRTLRGPKRQTVCGNAFCMAPEMLKHSYDERVDIFSFSIILVQMIARIPSDPETGVPRSCDFGLDQEKIRNCFVGPDTPSLYVDLAFLAGDINPDKRPPFASLHIWLNRLFLCIEAKLPVSQELHAEVAMFASCKDIAKSTASIDTNSLSSSCVPFLRATSEPFFNVAQNHGDSGYGDCGDLVVAS